MKTIQSLDHSEINSVKKLLQLSDLPYSDLEKAPIHFFGIKENNKLIVSGALEVYDTNAVLRSVAVQQAYKGLGYGKQIVRFLETKALAMEISKLFLLTTTAGSFFSKLNYLPIQRDLCPAEILSSAQFMEICPQSASCLFKNMKA